MAQLTREVIETLVAEAEMDMVDAIIHNEQLHYQQLKETRSWLLNLLNQPSRMTSTSNDSSRTLRSTNGSIEESENE
jgi:hypothetical protein